MKKPALALLALAAITGANAQTAPAPAPAPAPRTAIIPPQPAPLTVAECLVVLGGLNQLDGHQVIFAGGTPKEQIVTLSYEFGNGTLRRDITQDIVELQAVQRTAQTVQQQIFKEVAKGETEIKPNTPQMEEYNKQINEASVAPCPAKIIRIKQADLKLEKNEIAGTVLAALDKILDK